MLVEGNVAFKNANPGDSLTIKAGKNIEVNTDTGSIVMRDSMDKLAVMLNLNAPNVWIADQSILTNWQADPELRGPRCGSGDQQRRQQYLSGLVGADLVAIDR